jgi:hypothetical protein
MIRINYLLNISLSLAFFIFCENNSFGHTSVEVILKNDAQTSDKQYEFDVYLVSTGSSSFEMSLHQYGLNYNADIKNGGTVTAAWVAGTTEINPAQLQNTINTTSNASQMRIASTAAPGAGNGTIIPVPLVSASVD